MYKFTNGIITYDEKIKEAYLKAGFKLVKENKTKAKRKAKDENNINDGIIKEEPGRSEETAE